MEGLDLHKIGQIVLGTETPPETVDLKEICTNDRISKWAKWKPINYNKIGALTEEERRSVGYGLRTANADIPICFEGSIGSRDRENSIYEWIDNSLTLYNNGGDVIWDKPTERFRLTDFASEDMKYQFDGRERATYYMANGNSTYSPALGYYDDALTRCISIDDLIDPTTYPDLDNLEVVILYKYNGRHYIKSSGHNVGHLKSGYNIGITPDLPTTAGMHTFEGFFVAITPENELDTDNGWKNIFNNDDASATFVVAFRFPDSYFKGTYVVADPTVPEGEYIYVAINGKIKIDSGLEIPIRFVGNLSDYSWNVIVTVWGKIDNKVDKLCENPYFLSGDDSEYNTINVEPDGIVTEIAIVCYYVNNDNVSGFTISKLDADACISGETPSESDYYDISLFM